MALGQGPEQYIQARQETHVQLKKTSQNTRRSRRQQEWHNWSQAPHGQSAGTQLLWERGGGQAEQVASANSCQRPWPEWSGSPMAPCTGERGYTRIWDSVERVAMLVQTYLLQLSAGSEHRDRIEGVSPAAGQGAVLTPRLRLCSFIPALAPSASQSQTKPLPSLGTRLSPDPAGLRLPVALPH